MRRLAGLAVVLGAAVAAAGCGSGGGKDSIVVYNGQHLELTRALVDAFEKQTGINVRLRNNDGVVLADQIVQEGKGSPADVYITENSPELMNLQEKGLLEPVGKELVSQVPAAYRSPTGDWLGMALRVSSLAYDPAKVPQAQLPASILDLAKPAWRGKVAVSPLDSDFPPIVGAVIAAKGKQAAAQWLAGLKRNARIYQDEEAVVAAVDRGDVPVGLVNQYYWYRLRLEQGAERTKSRLWYFTGEDPGAVLNIAGAAVLASSKHREAAEKFLAFLVGTDGQKIVAKGDDYEYPVRADVPPNPALPPLARVPHTTFNVVKLGDDRDAAQLIAATGFGA